MEKDLFIHGSPEWLDRDAGSETLGGRACVCFGKALGLLLYITFDSAIKLFAHTQEMSDQPRFAISVQAGLRRQDVEANIRVANGPKGMRQEPHAIQRLVV